MTNIYAHHGKAFNRVSAFVIARDGERVATIAFKSPQDGAGRLYAYVHWLGIPMVRGFAGGGGYDKRTAACASAIRRMSLAPLVGFDDERVRMGEAFAKALEADRGPTWDSALREAGFEVWQAV